jgi:hypothetical protein
MTFILMILGWFLKNPRVLVMTGLAAGFAFMYIDLSHQKAKVAELENKRIALESKVAIDETRIKIQENLTVISQNRIVAQDVAKQDLDKAIEVIKSATQSKDGPVAEILKNTVDRQ